MIQSLFLGMDHTKTGTQSLDQGQGLDVSGAVLPRVG